MNSNCCGHHKPNVSDDAPQPKTRRLKKVAGWVVPGAVLALLPKCPMCLIAYAAICGVTMSASSAHIALRALTVLCIGTLALCVARLVVSCCHSKHTFNFHPTRS